MGLLAEDALHNFSPIFVSSMYDGSSTLRQIET